jgi:hypothetical protein
MLPLLLRDLFIGNSSSLDAGAAAAGAAFGGGGGNRTGGPPASTLPAAERAGTAGGATVTGSAGFAAAAGGAGAAARVGDGAGAPSHTDASAPSAEPECRRRRAATSELASASLCERSKHGASLRASVTPGQRAERETRRAKAPAAHEALQLNWSDILRQVPKVLFDLHCI